MKNKEIHYGSLFIFISIIAIFGGFTSIKNNSLLKDAFVFSDKDMKNQ